MNLPRLESQRDFMKLASDSIMSHDEKMFKTIAPSSTKSKTNLEPLSYRPLPNNTLNGVTSPSKGLSQRHLLPMSVRAF